MSERGTSKTCCICRQQHNDRHNGRVHRGLHYCKENNAMVNADVSGAYNILMKVAANGSSSSLVCPEQHTTQQERSSSSSRHLAMPLMLRWWEYHRLH
ncbi:MAG TPA: zinc ribbon domain-containing protein [Nitrososphaera sp.]